MTKPIIPLVPFILDWILPQCHLAVPDNDSLFFLQNWVIGVGRLCCSGALYVFFLETPHHFSAWVAGCYPLYMFNPTLLVLFDAISRMSLSLSLSPCSPVAVAAAL